MKHLLNPFDMSGMVGSNVFSTRGCPYMSFFETYNSFCSVISRELGAQKGFCHSLLEGLRDFAFRFNFLRKIILHVNH